MCVCVELKKISDTDACTKIFWEEAQDVPVVSAAEGWALPVHREARELSFANLVGEMYTSILWQSKEMKFWIETKPVGSSPKPGEENSDFLQIGLQLRILLSDNWRPQKGRRASFQYCGAEISVLVSAC